MNGIDWFVVFIYVVGMIWMAFDLGKDQQDEKDYYLGGNDMSSWSIGISTMATQCSTNSLLGAPAFVITTGLVWLQYEIAVPIAMIAIMIFLLPFFRKQGIISVYEYLEMRFGVATRTVLSVLFQFLRAFSTGVTVYGISLVLQQILNIPFWVAVLFLGIVTIVYDFFGGMKAVVMSDVIQMIILYVGIFICTIYAIKEVGGFAEVWKYFPKVKEVINTYLFKHYQIKSYITSTVSGASAIDLKHHGLGDGHNFAFWPMLFGGLFLYMSYYGCDQTQVQRELSTKSIDDTNHSLFINGILRFPLVLTYCFLGVALGAYIAKNPVFLKSLIPAGGTLPDFNLTVPIFVLKNLPHGIQGLIIVALFAAAMSSLDSTINSLSATTIRDIYERFLCEGHMDAKKQLKLSRYMTVFWGVLCTSFAFVVGGISKSIIESINKIGSLANGPILATFLLALLTKKANEKGTIAGIVAGFLTNMYLWMFVPKVSWLWWNVIGCVVTFVVGYIMSLIFAIKIEATATSTGSWILSPFVSEPPKEKLEGLLWQKDAAKFFDYKVNWPKRYAILASYTVLLTFICYSIQFLFK